MSLKGLIFDFDGLVLDTEVANYKVFRHWFKKNLDFDLSLQDFRVCVGSHYRDLLIHLKKTYGIEVDENTFALEIGEDFRELAKTLPANPGVIRLVEQGKKQGLKILLVTSSFKEKPVFHLKRLGLYPDFDAIITAEMVKRIKPHPDLYLKALEISGLEPCEAIVFEDSRNGLLSASTAGLKVIVVPNKVTEGDDFSESYKKVTSLELIDLQKLIKEYEKR